LDLGRYVEGADELIAELRANPLNLPLVRTELWEGKPEVGFAPAVIGRLRERWEESDSVPAERLLAADLLLATGSQEEALATVLPLVSDLTGSLALLQMTSTLAKEAPLIDDRELRLSLTDFLLAVLEDMATSSLLDRSLRTRVLDILAQVCQDALVANVLAGDPEATVQRLEKMLLLVKEGHPRSPHLYSAQIRLAHYLRDVLRRPEAAAAQLERLLTDLDLPLEGVALARLALGECYLAAADTARGRVVLTQLGRSSKFREAAGSAHFQLARLDLAEGHWETARDRFASVAMDNPMADYANDALDLGLAIAEELDNPTGGPSLLSLYARSAFFEITARPDSQRVTLENFVTFAATQVDMTQPQHLLERAHYELAQLYWRLGNPEAALAQCDRIILDHPDGRYPADALALQGRIMTAQNDQQRARQAYERLLVQYPDYLFADDVRERLRNLP
jgi:tetratricopeptide (TPR) repeat protein